jgi:peptide-methionine (S)-S-oxide reductase
MPVRVFAMLIVLTAAAPAQAQPAAEKARPDAKAEAEAEPEASADTGSAVFGGGCFWSMEALFERVPGVTSVVSGFAGGVVPNPSYEMVCTSETGHAEVVRVAFDPSVVTYDTLLKIFWMVHDPTTPNAQGEDFGPQYRSIILYENDAQKKAAQGSYRKLKAARTFKNPIVTELVPLNAFYPAEPYHQDYYQKHFHEPYCQTVIEPKVWKLDRKLRPASGKTAKKKK